MENLKKTLYLEKEESVPVYELLSVVAAQYNMTAEHYCEVRKVVAPAVNVPRSDLCVVIDRVALSFSECRLQQAVDTSTRQLR